jgi:hypothetical protein
LEVARMRLILAAHVGLPWSAYSAGGCEQKQR